MVIIRYVMITPHRVDNSWSGSRQMFGVICERHIVILVDCSASMATHWSELTNRIELLLNDQVIARGI